MRLSSHPNVLACHTSFIQETNLWLVMQLMDKGSSLNCIQSARIRHSRETNAYHRYTSSDEEEDLSLEELNARDDYNLQQRRYAEVDLDLERHITYILHETILGLKYIHDNGQIHRDIKGGNILLDGEGTVRIADFGVSGWLVHGGAQRENTRTFVGTPCWMVCIRYTFLLSSFISRTSYSLLKLTNDTHIYLFVTHDRHPKSWNKSMAMIIKLISGVWESQLWSLPRDMHPMRNMRP